MASYRAKGRECLRQEEYRRMHEGNCKAFVTSTQDEGWRGGGGDSGEGES